MIRRPSSAHRCFGQSWPVRKDRRERGFWPICGPTLRPYARVMNRSDWSGAVPSNVETPLDRAPEQAVMPIPFGNFRALGECECRIGLDDGRPRAMGSFAERRTGS